MGRQAKHTEAADDEIKSGTAIIQSPGDEGSLAQRSEQELTDIANEGYAEAVRIGKSCIDNLRLALFAAIKSGRALAIIRDGKTHGEWQPWLEQNFHGTRMTANRYIRLAEKFGNVTTMLQLPVSINQAYLLAGITNEPRDDDDDDDQTERPRYRGFGDTIESIIQPFIRWRNKVFVNELQDADVERLRLWREQLRAPYETYVEVEQRLKSYENTGK